MGTIPRSSLLLAALGLFLFVFVSEAQPLIWQDSKANAMGLALSQGKLVLLLAGRHSCSNCNYMQNTVCETNSPPIKQLIQNQYVAWFCAIDTSNEYFGYTNGLDSSFYLPLICCIDPATPDSYLDRTTDAQDVQVFYNRLLAQVANQMAKARISRCLVTTGSVNLSLTNLVWGKTNRIERSFDLRGWTPIEAIVSVSRGTNWSEPLDVGRSRAFYRISIR